MSRVVWIALIVAACGHPAPPPQPAGQTHVTPPAPDAAVPAPPRSLDQDIPKLAERGSKLFTDLAAAFAAAGEDCGAAVTKLGDLRTTYADVVAANAKVLHEGRTRELKAALEPYSDTNDAAAKRIVESPTMAKCAPDPAFMRAFDDLVAPP